jgi:hypothetical protein
MSMSKKMYTRNDVEMQRYHPPGRYVGYITAWRKDVANTGTEFIVFSLKAREGLSGQDLKGVELNRELTSRRFYLSEAAIKQYWTAIQNADPEWLNKLPEEFGEEDAAELLVGAEVEFDYTAEKNKTTGKEYLNVQRWKKA